MVHWDGMDSGIQACGLVQFGVFRLCPFLPMVQWDGMGWDGQWDTGMWGGSVGCSHSVPSFPWYNGWDGLWDQFEMFPLCPWYIGYMMGWTVDTVSWSEQDIPTLTLMDCPKGTMQWDTQVLLDIFRQRCTCMYLFAVRSV